MRSYLEKDTPAQITAMRGDLTMPPDLRLPAPGTTAPAPDSGAAETQAALTAPPPPASAPAPAKAASAPAENTSGVNSIYTNAGISLYKPDGTKKTDSELREELQQYYIAQKRAKNPNYGTVFNVGNIFKDE